ncbi:MAG: class II fructose-bisphosphate aldolase [Patescibacteria group bacterium]
MKSLYEYIVEAQKEGKAVGHFNISTLDGIWAVADAAQKLDLPVIIGISEGERDYVGVKQAVAIVQSIRAERGQAIFLNADHTYSYERVVEAIDAGFDSVIFDGAKLSLEENIAESKKCVQYAQGKMSASGNQILVEAELGYIGTSSKVLDKLPEGAALGDSLTTSADALRFVQETGVNLFAPAVGNIHGVVKGGDPALNPGRVAEISQAVGIPLVLHGASGNTDAEIRQCIQSGVAVVHVNTELRLAYRQGLSSSLVESPDEVSPYKYLRPAKEAMQKVAEDKLRVFNMM